MEFILSVLTGGATGIIGSVIGKIFGFVDGYLEEKKKDKEHTRTIEMTRLQSELRSQELESEREIVQTQQDGQIKTAAYDMFVNVPVPYPWVAAILRLIRPILTLMLVGIVGYIYAT